MPELNASVNTLNHCMIQTSCEQLNTIGDNNGVYIHLQRFFLSVAKHLLLLRYKAQVIDIANTFHARIMLIIS